MKTTRNNDIEFTVVAAKPGTLLSKLTWAGEKCTGGVVAYGRLVAVLFGARQVAVTDDMAAWIAERARG